MHELNFHKGEAFITTPSSSRRKVEVQLTITFPGMNHSFASDVSVNWKLFDPKTAANIPRMRISSNTSTYARQVRVHISVTIPDSFRLMNAIGAVQLCIIAPEGSQEPRQREAFNVT